MSNIDSHFKILIDAILAQKSRPANLDDPYETLLITPCAVTHCYVVCGITVYHEVSYLGILLITFVIS
jgi:hypothetical protein